MRVILAVVLVGLAQGATVRREEECTLHEELKYEYRAVAYNGIPGTSQIVSGVETNMTFLIKNFQEPNQMQLEIVKCSSAPLPEVSQPSETEICKELKRHGLPFDMLEGRVVGIYPGHEEKEEILNLKRGILSAFQVNPTGSDLTQMVDEMDILGICPTEISESRGENEIEILKQRETEKCRGRPKHTVISLSQDQEARFVYGRMVASYRLDMQGRILLAELTQDEELAPMTKEAGRILTHINQTFWLVKSREQCSQLVDVEGRQKASLVFDYSISPDADVASVEDIEEIISDLVKANTKDIPELFIELIAALRKMSLNDLKDVQHKLKLSERKQSAFLDALAFTATDQAVELIVDLTHPDYSLSKTRKTELALSLAAVPVQYADPCNLLASALKLARNRDTCQSSTLALGTVINRVREYNPLVCNLEVNKAIEYLEGKIEQRVRQLPENYNPTGNAEHARLFHAAWEQAIDAIKALGNAGVPKSISKLEESIKEKRLLIEGRTAAIYSLQRISQKSPLKVREIGIQLYVNSANEVEIRVAGFSIFIRTMARSCSSSFQMRQALQQAAREPNREVQSYVCSYLSALRQSRDPFYRTLRSCVFYYEKWTKASKSCAATSHSIFSSSAYRWYKPISDMVKPLSRDTMGAALSLGYVSTNASRVPRAVSAKLKANLFGYDMYLMEAGLRMTGIEKLICSMLLGSEGYIHLGSLSEEAYDLLCGSHDENTSVSVYMKAMGDELMWKNFRPKTTVSSVSTFRDHIIDLFGKAKALARKVFEIAQFLSSGHYPVWSKKLKFNKTVGFLDIRRVVPTIIGMPINLIVSAAGHMEFNFTSFVEYKTDHPFKVIVKWITSMFGDKPHEALDAHIVIQPRLSIAAKVQVLLDDYQFKPKLVFFGNSSSNFTQRIFARIHDDYTVDVSITEMPDNETLLLNASFTQYAEVEGKKQELTLQQQKQKSVHVNTYDLVGLDLYANVSYPIRSGYPMATLVPLSGPANLTVSIRRPNANLSKLQFSFRKSDLKWASVSVDSSLVAVGVNRSIDGSLQWKLENKVFVLNSSILSALANSSTFFIVNTSSPFTIDSHFNFNSSLANMTIGMGLNSTNFNANSSLFIAKHRIYEAELNASRQSFSQGNLSFILFIRDRKSPHLFNLTGHLSKWYASITGDLLLSGKSEPHHVNIGGSFGKYFANLTGLFMMAGHCMPYQMGFNGSYHNGSVSGWAMIDLPHILKRQDLLLNATVGKWFADVSALLHQEGKPVPHKVDIRGTVGNNVSKMFGLLLLSGQTKPHTLSMSNTMGKWYLHSLAHLHIANRTKPNYLNVTGRFTDGSVTGKVFLDTYDLFKYYHHNELPSNSFKRFFAKVSNGLHQPKYTRDHRVKFEGKLDKWYSNITALLRLAKDKHEHQLNFNGSFAKWYINASAFLLPHGQKVPHRVHLSGNMGKWFLNGSAFFQNASESYPYNVVLNGSVGKLWVNGSVSYHHAEEQPHRVYLNGSVGKLWIHGNASYYHAHKEQPYNVYVNGSVGKFWINGSASYHHGPDKRPYTLSLNGSVGKVWVNGSAAFQMARDQEPHRASLRGVVGKWFINVSSTLHLQLNDWDEHYLNSNISLVGRAIKLSANSSLLGLSAVKNFLRIDGKLDGQKVEQKIIVMEVDTVMQRKCKSTKQFVSRDEKRCVSRRRHDVCMEGCEPIYGATRVEEFRCLSIDDWDELKAHNISLVQLEFRPVLHCRRKQ